MEEELPNRIGVALFAATLLALIAIAAAETFGFVFFEDEPLPVVEVRTEHPHIYAAMAACLNEPTAIKLKDEIVATCRPRKK